MGIITLIPHDGRRLFNMMEVCGIAASRINRPSLGVIHSVFKERVYDKSVGGDGYYYRPFKEDKLKVLIGGALRLMLYGWNAIIPDIDRVAETLGGQDRIVNDGAWEPSVAGQLVNVGAYCSGDPECMLSLQTPDVELRDIELYVDSTSPSNTSEKLEQYAMGTIAVIRALVARGYNVRLWSGYVASAFNAEHPDPDKRRVDLAFGVSLYAPGDTLDYTKIAAALHFSYPHIVVKAFLERCEVAKESGLLSGGETGIPFFDRTYANVLNPLTPGTLRVRLPPHDEVQTAACAPEMAAFIMDKFVQPSIDAYNKDNTALDTSASYYSNA